MLPSINKVVTYLLTYLLSYLLTYLLDKRNCLHKKRVALPEDWFGTLTWPLFYCFRTPICIWLPRRHVTTRSTLNSSRVAHNYLPKEIFTGNCKPSFWNSTTRSLIHLKASHMVKINYTHQVLLSEWNTCLRNLIILHPKRKRNIP